MCEGSPHRRGLKGIRQELAGGPRRPLTGEPSCSFTQERCHSSRATGENQISQSRLRLTQFVEFLPPWHPKLENRKKNKGSGGSGNLLWMQICPCPTSQHHTNWRYRPSPSLCLTSKSSQHRPQGRGVQRGTACWCDGGSWLLSLIQTDSLPIGGLGAVLTRAASQGWARGTKPGELAESSLRSETAQLSWLWGTFRMRHQLL